MRNWPRAMMMMILAICAFLLLGDPSTAALDDSDSLHDSFEFRRGDFSSRSDSFEDHAIGGSGEGQGQPQQSAGIRRIELENMCFGSGASLALGPCSSTFLKCGRFSADRQFSFEECPLGSVFVGKECKEARKVRECFQPEVNLLNDATEKLAQLLAVDFCARHNSFDATLHFFDGPTPEHKCSRQALVCRGTAALPLAIGCPTGKVLNLKSLGCEEAPERCLFVANDALAPIRQHLLRLHCAQSRTGEQGDTPLLAPVFPNSMMKAQQAQLVHQTKDRCRNWYTVCDQEPELVFCDNGKMYDAEKGICRRVLPEDRCPFIGVCKGWEWRTSPVGDCRPDFLFCNGMRPQLFQCEREGEVFKDGDCTPASSACDVCQMGESKRSADKCEEFFFCERDSDTGRTHWRQYICTNNRVFHPQRKECVAPSLYQCPTRTQCKEGESHAVECGDFFICTQSKFVPGKCPDMTRWDVSQRRCVYAPQCRRFQTIAQKNNAEGQCQDGQSRPSADCKQFEECVGGKWAARRCHDYANSRLKTPCRFCPVETTNSFASGGPQPQQNDNNIYPLERLLPENFNPFDKQGVRQRRCVEGEKIVNRHDCAHFMECVDGDWFNLACPRGHFFSPRSQGCVMATSANSSAIPMCQDLLFPAEVSQSHLFDRQADSVYLLPILSPNDTLAERVSIGPGAGPLPELRDTELRQNYAGAFDFCDGGKKSPRRVPNAYDCTKYRECALDQGGYYAEKQCALGTQFDPKLLQCTYNYTCIPPKCVEGIREALQQCGRGRQCTDGEWREFTCPNQMAFAGGECSGRVRCQSTNPSPNGQCVDGHTRSHPRDCSKYLLCRYGLFLEENCNNGHRFNPKIGRCDPHYECPVGRRPPCYEGEMRPLATAKGKCNVEHELCRDGKWEHRSCPYDEHFEATSLRCVHGNCGGSVGGGTGGGDAALGRAEGQKCQEAPGAAGFRSDRADCAKFYHCAAGKWVPKECAKGTVFNPALGVCDWAANVPGC